MLDYNQIPSPCYVLEEPLLERNLKIIKQVADEAGVEIIMAFKGFSMHAAFPVVRKYFGGATASSFNEAKLAVEEMKARPHVYAPAYTEDEFPEIAGMASHITFNSLSQFEHFYPWLKQHQPKVSVGLRVNPGWSPAKTEIYNPCAPGSRLGIPAQHFPNELPDGVEGLHFHALCENGAEDLQGVLQHFEQRFAKYIPKLKWINMGGGHLITHKEYNRNLLIDILKDFKKRHNVHVILEPGATFAWETGFLLATVVDVVKNNGIETAMLDVSFTAHMPDCLEMPYKPRIRNAHNEPVKSKPTYRLGGNSCLSGDFMGDWSFDKELKPGERLIFEDMIHYTMVKTSFFNGVKHPSIGIIDGFGKFKLVKSFGYDEFRNKLS